MCGKKAQQTALAITTAMLMDTTVAFWGKGHLICKFGEFSVSFCDLVIFACSCKRCLVNSQRFQS